MAGKVRAACDARASDETLVIARTDAIAVEGFDAALDRAGTYLEAGADMLFVEAPRSREQMEAITQEFGDRVPLMANMVEGGKTPVTDAADLESLGFDLVIFPGGVVRALAATACEYYGNLLAKGSNAAFRNRMYDFKGLNDVIGAADMLAAGENYEDKS